MFLKAMRSSLLNYSQFQQRPQKHFTAKIFATFLFCFRKGLGTQLKGSEDVKKGLLQEEDPLLVEKTTLPVSVQS